MDRFNAMLVFVKVVEVGSFTKAADILNMSPQLVGKQVSSLEKYLGVQLLNRTTRRQSLTDFGRTFYDRAKSILFELEWAESLAADTRSTPMGRIRVNAPVTFGMHTLAPRLPQYLASHPQVDVELTLSNREIDLVGEGYDAVFRLGTLADSNLIARALAPYEFVACASPAYLSESKPIATPMDLIDHQCLTFSNTEFRTHWTFDGPGGRTIVPVSSRFESDHGEVLFWAALNGLGVVLQPRALVRHGLAAGRLVTILPNYTVPTRQVHIVYSPTRTVTPKLRSFLDFAVDSFG